MLLLKTARCLGKNEKIVTVLTSQLITHLNKRTLSNAKSHELTDFGFQTVKKEEKAGKVNEVFSSVAQNYDLMNDVMSAGIHRIWKDKLISTLNPDANTVLLDSAGGTGDIATRFMRYSASEGKGPGRVTVCDLNVDMLNEGKKRAKKQKLDITWEHCSADDLPFDDNSFTAYTISFGIRNCTDKDKVLREAYRVLKPGGRFLCLEFSHVTHPMLKSIYKQYSFNVIPVMGECVANDWKSYQYLAESIAKFPTQENFAEMIRDAGFSAVTYEDLTFGVCAIHSGFKL